MKQGDLLQIVRESIALDEKVNPDNDEVNAIIRKYLKRKGTPTDKEQAILDKYGITYDNYHKIFTGPNGEELRWEGYDAKFVGDQGIFKPVSASSRGNYFSKNRDNFEKVDYANMLNKKHYADDDDMQTYWDPFEGKIRSKNKRAYNDDKNRIETLKNWAARTKEMLDYNMQRYEKAVEEDDQFNMDLYSERIDDEQKDLDQYQKEIDYIMMFARQEHANRMSKSRNESYKKKLSEDFTNSDMVYKLRMMYVQLDDFQETVEAQSDEELMWLIGEAMGSIDNLLDYTMTLNESVKGKPQKRVNESVEHDKLVDFINGLNDNDKEAFSDSLDYDETLEEVLSDGELISCRIYNAIEDGNLDEDAIPTDVLYIVFNYVAQLGEDYAIAWMNGFNRARDGSFNPKMNESMKGKLHRRINESMEHDKLADFIVNTYNTLSDDDKEDFMFYFNIDEVADSIDNVYSLDSEELKSFILRAISSGAAGFDEEDVPSDILWIVYTYGNGRYDEDYDNGYADGWVHGYARANDEHLNNKR